MNASQAFVWHKHPIAATLQGESLNGIRAMSTHGDVASVSFRFVMPARSEFRFSHANMTNFYALPQRETRIYDDSSLVWDYNCRKYANFSRIDQGLGDAAEKVESCVAAP